VQEFKTCCSHFENLALGRGNLFGVGLMIPFKTV
jgi:hypothetical protein